MIINNAVLTGSFTVNGVNYITNTPTTGSNTYVGTQTTSGSAIITGSLQVTGSVSTTGTITAQTLVVQTVTSSIIYSSGSNIFGNSSTNTQKFTGSVLVSGSVLIGNNSPAGTERFGVTRDDGVTDGLHIIADFNRSGSLSAELILGYYASGSAVTGPVVYAANSQPLLFGAGSVERMRLTATGNLGIGTTNPVGKLDVALVNTRRFIVTYDDSIITIKGASDTGAGENLRIIGDNLIFNTNSVGSGTERMRITSVGQIGINTSSPVTTSLTGSITIYKAYNADQASVPSTTAQAYYGNQHGLYLFGRNSGLSIISANSEEGSIKFGNASTSVYASIGTATGASAVGGDMYFKVGTDTERMRITATGQTNFIHSTTNLDVVTLQNGSASPYGMNITYTAASPNNGSNNFLYLADSTALRFAARSNGGLSNFSGNNVNLASDIRLKKDIVSLSSEWDKLKQIEVVNFRYKDSNEETTLYGAIAQQVQEVYPNLVIVTREATETEPEYYGLREQPFQWLTTKVLQEAMTKIEEQQIQIQNLQSQIESQNTLIQELTTRLTALENK